MTFLVVQYESRNNKDLRKLMNRNKQICDTTDKLLYYKGTTDTSLPAYWVKVKLIRNLLLSSDYVHMQGFLWLDSDAVIHDVDGLVNEMNNTETFMMSGDLPIFSQFCAGVWFVRNNSEGCEIMKKWYSAYVSDCHKHWICRNGVWEIKQLIFIYSLHPGYEQAAFVKYILNKNRYKIREVPWNFLNTPNMLDRNALTLHFYGHIFKNVISTYLKLTTPE